MNLCLIIGNLVRDPETHTTQNGKTVCNFSVAVAKRRQAVDGADFFRVSAWNELGQNCMRYLSKGKKVAVVGAVSTSTYRTQSGEIRASLDISAQEVEFLTPRGESQQKTPENDYVEVETQLPF